MPARATDLALQVRALRSTRASGLRPGGAQECSHGCSESPSATRGKPPLRKPPRRGGGRRRNLSRFHQLLTDLFTLLTLLTLLTLPPHAFAHPAVSTVAVVKVTTDHHIEITLTHDALAYALNDTSARVSDPQMYELLGAPEADLAAALLDGKERFASGFRLIADDNPIKFELIQWPTVEAVAEWKAGNPRRQLPCKLDFVVHATLPTSARTISVRFPAILGDVILSVDRPGVEPIYLPLAPGETAPAMDVSMVKWGGRPARRPGETAPPVGMLNIAWRYTRWGFLHIIPGGADHALFVLSLFLLSPRLKALLWQITAFTIAHSITLFLTTFNIISMPSAIIEPTIAVTIAFIAVENLFTTRVRAWRPAVAFLFGLVHGMGFASALREVGLPTGQLVAGVIAFNIGVEGGHLAVLSLAFLLMGWFRNKPWYRRRIAIPLSLLIAAVAVFWMAQRLLTQF